MIVDIEGLQTELRHPLRVIFPCRDIPDNFLRKTTIRLVNGAVFVSYIIERALYILYKSFLLCHDRTSFCLSDKMRKAIAVDFVNKLRAALGNNASLHENMNTVYLELRQNARVVGDDDAGIFLVMECAYTL